MQKIIDWKLLSNNEVVHDLSDVIIEYVSDHIFSFKDIDCTNMINLMDKTYERSNDEYKMIIDCNKKIVSFIFKSGEECSFDIEATMDISDNNLRIIYRIDDDEKTIIIDMKE